MIVAENVVVSDAAAVRRRIVLKGGAVAAAGASIALAAPAGADAPVFRHGVASGDPLPDGVIIWTRVTVADAATPGSGAGATAAVRWEVAADENFASITAAGTTNAAAASDHTVKVDVTGLAPGCVYFYRFTALDQTSPVGRTRTAPELGSAPDRLRFGVVSCANWEAGFFGAYRHLAGRTDLDAILHLGDYLYEYGRGEYGGRTGSVRPHDPANEIVTLADYRIRHAQYKTDPDLQRLHALLPFICTWDDHESADNSWSGGSSKHDPATMGSWADRRAASARAYLEWMPVRASSSGSGVRIYRRLRFGTLAELSMLDLRSYRDQEVKPGAGWREVDNPERTLTGRAQMDWLTAGLASSTATWKLVGNSVMIAPLVFPPLDPTTTAAITQTMGIPQSGLPANADQWDGYTADRARLYRAITERGVSDVVFLTGDIHSSWAADLPVNAADPAGPSVGAEFVVPSVTSSSMGELMHAPPRTAAVPVEEAIKGVNRHLRYVELDSHGFGVLDVTAAQTQMDWFYVFDVADAGTGIRHGASFAVRAGGRVEPRPAPTL
ncbi:alkaline phosphatase D family protein [Nocardia cyriacigeorgica]|uniref:Alkaline phosphatase n=1 Tax=Nocardia cyriacigeorgica TaxID=135487 RepID=A0A6P1D0C7_9NOCA|nr:alkaline phosphatase D family protein [Nocardia cyriacigeorgica]NEW40518.1 alkaline phosphatase [Nocardia cyriacigeorgica]NEW43029.1 alkaline phosphatase [Nocardia cyriacigeorgica]